MSWLSEKMKKNKWHPAAGEWGLGSTHGSKQAYKNRASVRGQITDVEGRRGGVTDYFSNLQDISDTERGFATEGRDIEKETARGKFDIGKRAGEQGYLSSLENFLTKSYSIGSESDARATKSKLATAADPLEQFKLQMRRNQIGQTQDAQMLKDEAMGQDFRQSYDAGDLAQRTKMLGFDKQDLTLGMEQTKALQGLDDQLFQLREALATYS